MGLHILSIADLDLDDTDEVNALVFLDDEGFDWNHDINKIVILLRVRNIPCVVANTNKSYPDDKVSIAIGGIADMVERITGRMVKKFRKPDAQMFIFAYEHSQRAQEGGKLNILMVGDTLVTNIIGGNKFGIDTALVLTSNTLRSTVEEQIHLMGIVPDFIYQSG